MASDEHTVIPAIPILRAALLLAVLAAVLLACGSNTATTSPDQRPLATPETTTTVATPIPDKSPRGLIPKKLGEVAGLSNRDDEEVLRFAVTKITVDPKCEAPSAAYSKPENGHLVRVDMTIETAASYKHSDALFQPSQMQWSIQGPDGFTESGSTLGTFAAYSCAPESLPVTLNPSSKYLAVIMLDSKNTSGILMFQPYLLGGENDGWEWPF